MSLQSIRAGLRGLGGAGLGRVQAGLRLASTKSDPLHRETQNPKVTGDASLQDTPRDVPTGAEIGSEKEVKWGVNIPSSPEQLKEELKYAGKGLAESVEAGVAAMASKAKDYVDEAKRTAGMEAARPAMSQEEMGAAGKMQHPTTGMSGGPSEHARAKYDEIKSSEAANFPEGERSVTEQWARAGSYQNSPEAASKLVATPEEQHTANVEIQRELEQAKRGAGGGGSSRGSFHTSLPAADMDESHDTGSGLEENLHKRGP